MFVFDTDHLSLLQHGTSPEFESIARRCSSQLASEFFVTIVSFHEQINGWTKYVAKSKNSGSLVHGYSKLEGLLDDFARAQVLPFSPVAADIYDELRKLRLTSVGAMDLRIASIAIANQMTLLTRNTVAFERIPNLTFEDWTT